MDWLNWQTILITALGISIGGIFRDALMALWGKLINRLPWAGKNNTGNTLTINGEWETTFTEGGQKYNEKVSLDLIGSNVKGEINLIDPNDRSKVTDTYRFKGVFKDRVLAATYESNDPTDYEMGAFALLYEKRQFEGQYIFFSNENGRERIIASPYTWKKIE